MVGDFLPASKMGEKKVKCLFRSSWDWPVAGMVIPSTWGHLVMIHLAFSISHIPQQTV